MQTTRAHGCNLAVFSNHLQDDRFRVVSIASDTVTNHSTLLVYLSQEALTQPTIFNMSDAAAAPAPSPVKKAAKKPTKPKAPAAHPPIAEMVVAAIKALKDRKGSSLPAIKKYLSANYKVDVAKVAPFLKRFLRNAVTAGKLVQVKGTGASGSFKLSAATKAEKPKKPAAKKSPKKAAKKPAAKKPAAKKSPKKAAKKPAAKKAAAKPAAKKPAAKKAAAKKPAAKKTPVKKAPAKKTPTKKAARKPAAKKTKA